MLGIISILTKFLDYTPFPQLKRSPFVARKGWEVSYLLFSITCCPSFAGACLVGAGSIVASLLGEPVVSDLGGFPFMPPSIVDEDPGLLLTALEYSRDSWICLRFLSFSNRSNRSALMDFFAK
jgi:hypothetical protein